MTPTKNPAVVLVADDEPSMLSLIAQHVRTLGHHVHLAHDGEEAWSQVEAHRPDLVLLDVMMPAMSGWEVCRKIREDRSLGKTAVIMITGIGERLNEMTSPLFGADHYLDKPFELVDLDRAITAVLAKRGGPAGSARAAAPAPLEMAAKSKKAAPVAKGKPAVKKTVKPAAKAAKPVAKAAKAAPKKKAQKPALKKAPKAVAKKAAKPIAKKAAKPIAKPAKKASKPAAKKAAKSAKKRR